jgi:hypothetical protein
LAETDEEEAPAWVEEYLIPRIEFVIRSVLREEFARYERAMWAKVYALDP